MTMDDYKKLYYAEPFKPFVVRLSNGQRLPVLHRYNTGFNPEGGTRVGVALPDVSVLFDISEVVAIEASTRPRKGKRPEARSKSDRRGTKTNRRVA